MAKTVYVDLDLAADVGTGTSGDPYGHISYALAQEDATADDVTYKLRATVDYDMSKGGAETLSIITAANTSIVLEPDDGLGILNGFPQIVLYSTRGFNPGMQISQLNVTVRELEIQHRSSGSSQRDAIRATGSSNSTFVLEKCHVYANRYTVSCENGDNDYTTIRNCLLANYSDNNDCNISIASFANIRIYNSIISAGGGTNAMGFGSSGIKDNTEIRNCVFIHCVNENNTAGLTASNNATTNPTGTNIGPTPVTDVVAADFEAAAITNPRTGGADFRLATDNTNLLDAGFTVPSFSDDIEGTARPQGPAWDIGYHELSTAAPPVTGGGIASAQDASVAGDGERIIPGFGDALAQASIVVGVGDVLVAVQVLLTAAENRELRTHLNTVVGNKLLNWEWYDTPGVTDGDPIDAGQITTNAGGEAIINVLGSSLTNGQEGQLILYDPVDPYRRGTYQVPVTD